MRYVVGLDVSTTGVKAVLVDETGAVRGSVTREHGLATPHPLWSEQNPADWWDGAQAAISTLLARGGIAKNRIMAVGLTGQMHGLVLLDSGGDIIRPAILWNDQRTAAECDTIRHAIDRDELIKLTGNDALTGLTLPKLLWVRENEPDAYERIAHILLPKDYIRYRLTNGFATDKAGAAGTLMLDLASREWSERIRSAFDVPAGWLPPTHEGPTITGTISRAGSEATGLPEGVPVVAGAGDQAAQAIGVGAVRPGDASITIGTSGVVFCSTNGAIVDPKGRLQAFCHGIPDRWHLMGVMLSAAGSLRWFRDTVAPDMSYSSLGESAVESDPTSGGLLFLPYLSGERMPYPDPFIRGGFLGLTSRHTRSDMVRAIMEGVSYGLRDGMMLLSQLLEPACTSIRVSGGGAQSPLWLRILASVLDAPLCRVSNHEGAAQGAALLAGIGSGLWSSVDEACDAAVSVDTQVEPDPHWAKFYTEGYRLYRASYSAIQQTCYQLGDLERKCIGNAA